MSRWDDKQLHDALRQSVNVVSCPECERYQARIRELEAVLKECERYLSFEATLAKLRAQEKE